MFQHESLPDAQSGETYSPWTVVRLVFDHLAAQGLHPILGEGGDPGEAASGLLRTLGIEPQAGEDSRLAEHVQQQLAELRATFLDAAEEDTARDGTEA